MNYAFSWLCWMSVWLFLSFCGESKGDHDPSSSSSHTNSSAPVGLHGYRRYFANDSLIGRPVPCTRDDKICFRHNLVFHPTHNICVPVGGSDVYRAEFERGSGRFLGAKPKYADPCTGYRMAYDGICYENNIVHDVICGRDANLTRHPLGNEECRVAQPNPIFIEQPEEDGSCVIPDIRFPDAERRVFFNNPFSEIQGFQNDNPGSTFTPKALECEPAQAACFSERKVFVSGYNGCHILLQQGPCAQDHVVALDLQAASKGRAEGTCVHVRGGCPKGYKRMVFDGECHEDREIQIEAPGEIILNQFGNNIVTFLGLSGFIPIVKENFCVILLSFNAFGVGEPMSSPPCGANNMGECKSYEVVNEPPKPIP
ncbi:hypothetical protein R5R35_001118 [Gryllus longicercus]|uniref:Uncharacterized protein n=1 Tax=Gryllus longicercus TaxID=2509291 RepID=A0AAN9Z430_9ORTH